MVLGDQCSKCLYWRLRSGNKTRSFTANSRNYIGGAASQIWQQDEKLCCYHVMQKAKLPGSPVQEAINRLYRSHTLYTLSYTINYIPASLSLTQPLRGYRTYKVIHRWRICIYCQPPVASLTFYCVMKIILHRFDFVVGR